MSTIRDDSKVYDWIDKSGHGYRLHIDERGVVSFFHKVSDLFGVIHHVEDELMYSAIARESVCSVIARELVRVGNLLANVLTSDKESVTIQPENLEE